MMIFFLDAKLNGTVGKKNRTKTFFWVKWD
jgi:hypothetical protein